MWQGARHIPGAQAAIVLLLPEPAEERFVTLDRYDLGQATYAMLLAATDLGIGTAHSSIGDQDKARAILGFPDGYIAAYMIGLGYPGRSAPAPDRRSRIAARSTRSCTAAAGEPTMSVTNSDCNAPPTRSNVRDVVRS